MKLGHDFGTAPMGVQQVAAVAEREATCTCDEELRALGVDTIDCPVHGLVAFCRSLAESAE